MKPHLQDIVTSRGTFLLLASQQILLNLRRNQKVVKGMSQNIGDGIWLKFSSSS